MRLLKDTRDRIVLVNSSISGNQLTAGYFYCDRGLPAGNYQLVNPETKRTVTVKLPDQAVNLPGVGQQFNYPFKIIEAI